MGKISAVDSNINAIIWLRGHLFGYDYYEKYTFAIYFAPDGLLSDDCEPADGIPWSRNILWLPVSSQKRLTWSTNSSLIVQSTRIEGCMCWTLWNCLAWLHFGLQGRWCMFEQLYSGGDWVHWRWVWFSYHNLIWHKLCHIYYVT